MDDKKDIGKLFKDRLANTEVEPNNTLWTSIEKTLDEKQRRRGRIIWFWGGLSILFILFSVLYITYDIEPKATKKPIIETPVLNSEPISIKDKNIEGNKQLSNSHSDIISETNDPNRKKSTNSVSINTNKYKVEKSTSKNQSTLLHEIESEAKSEQKDRTKKETLNKSYTSRKKESALDKKKKRISSEISSQEKSIVPRSLSDSKKLNITEEPSIPKDSLKPNGKLDQINKQIKDQLEPKKKKEDLESKWQISIQAAPTVLGFLSKGTPFDKGLSSGQLRSDLSYSYGVLLNIPLNEKLTFRFGFRNTNLKYYVEEASVVLSDNGVLPILNPSLIKRNANTLTTEFIESLNSPNTFRIDQKIKYQEVPFEFLYRIRNKSVKIDAIFGLSGMLLNKNNISLKSNTGKIDIGSAAYLKKFTISSSVGVGFRYELSENIRLDLEPTFQYQYGAFEKNIKNRHPFILSLQLGTTIKL